MFQIDFNSRYSKQVRKLETINGNYLIYSYADAKNDSKMLLTMGSLSKTLNFMNGTFGLNGRGKYFLISFPW